MGQGYLTVGFSIGRAPHRVRRTQASLSLRAQLLSQQCGLLWPAGSPRRWRWCPRDAPAPHGPREGRLSPAGPAMEPARPGRQPPPVLAAARARQDPGVCGAIDFWEASCLCRHSPTGARVGPSAAPGVSAALKHPMAAGRCQHRTSSIIPAPTAAPLLCWRDIPKRDCCLNPPDL